MVSIVYAMGGPGGGAAGGQGGIASLVPLILMFVIFYFLLIRPQQKKAKEHQEMLKNLKKGDRIITNGGLYGQIIALDTESISLEIADKVRVKIGRGYVAGLLKSPSQEQSQKKQKPEKQKSDQLKSK
ncbi:Sec translocon accessory complex subunit [Desulfonema limicola]|uniref:Sec translocon accessory complex subunit YajC n=1 Tax=Desulfonema limicola TaxID=45656 RepID=A0A975BBS9_9BACT|nr:preprotein translocase subunit YajC [Desulfonema limicola]QTA82428.1 Sec translocon accessory complex subunit [Desulfonema limicola]